MVMRTSWVQSRRGQSNVSQMYFAKNGIEVKALDYSNTAIASINRKKDELKLDKLIKTQLFDVRKKLPLDNEKFEGCFSHMLYCMALSSLDLKNSQIDKICNLIKKYIN